MHMVALEGDYTFVCVVRKGNERKTSVRKSNLLESIIPKGRH